MVSRFFTPLFKKKREYEVRVCPLYYQKFGAEWNKTIPQVVSEMREKNPTNIFTPLQYARQLVF